MQSPEPAILPGNVREGGLATSLFGPQSASFRDGVRYFNGTYAPDHWIHRPFGPEDADVVAFSRFKGAEFVAFLNPCDSRGYRMIVRLLDRSDRFSIVNREYRADEEAGLALTTTLVELALRSIVPVVQVFKLGNCAHSLEDGVVVMGNPDEPSILHAHLVGRGDPSHAYVPGIPLGGPSAGLLFDLTGTSERVAGNDKVIPWETDAVHRVAGAIRAEIPTIAERFKSLGLYVDSLETCRGITG